MKNSSNENQTSQGQVEGLRAYRAPLQDDFWIHDNGWASPRTPGAARKVGCGTKFQSKEQAIERLRAEGFCITRS